MQQNHEQIATASADIYIKSSNLITMHKDTLTESETISALVKVTETAAAAAQELLSVV